MPLKKRIDFERKNFTQTQCRSFKSDFLVADYCFEVSSEGELEQVLSLIEHYLQKKKRIEILFASPSVEKKCLKLAEDYKDQVRVLRLPIASFAPVPFLFFQSPWAWVSAPTLIFCRYDFFPELLSFKFLGKKLILLSASAKKASWFKTQSHGLFNLIVAANETQARSLRESTGQEIKSFDFRVPRIFKRQALALQTLGKVSELSTYLCHLESKQSKKLIMGSAWESDLIVFKGHHKEWQDDLLAGAIDLLIVPHNLGNDSIMQLKKSLSTLMPQVPLYEIKKGVELDLTVFWEKPGIVLLNLSGVLCELYSQFSLVYVGGGYERSIHSVLEPFLSGRQVVVGPKISRSTEYDNILDLAPDEIHLLNDPESFYNLVKTITKAPPPSEGRMDLKKESLMLMESIIKEIESC